MLDGIVEAQIPEIWALERLLVLGGVDGTASRALGLAGGAGFVATSVKGGRKAPARLHISGWNSFQTDIVGAIDRLGMIGAFDETTNRRGAAAALAAVLDGQRPVALWVDGVELGLGRAERGPVPEPMVVLATAHGSGIELVGPTDDATGERVVTVDAATLSVARDAIPAHRNRLLTVQTPTEEYSAAMRAGLATMAVGPIGGPRQRTGPEGVAQLGRALTSRGFSGWRTVFDGGWPLLAALSTLASAIRAEQGLLRAEQACFERSAADVLGIAALRDVADAHDYLAAGWLAVADLALPPDMAALGRTRAAAPTAAALEAAHGDTFPMSRTDLEAILARTAEAVSSLASAERDALELLRTTLRNH